MADGSVSEAPSGIDEKCCSTCSVPLGLHFGKHGPGRCFGKDVTLVFKALFEEIQQIKTVNLESLSMLKSQQSEGRDREEKLNKNIEDLKAEIIALKAEVSSLKGLGQVKPSDTPEEVRQPKGKRRKPKADSEAVVSYAKAAAPTLVEGSQAKENVFTSAGSCWANECESSDEISVTEGKSCLEKISRLSGKQEKARDDHKHLEKSKAPPTLLDFAPDDSSWKLVSSRKPRSHKRTVLYVGNLAQDTSLEDLEKFLLIRAEATGSSQIKIHRTNTNGEGTSSRLFDKENGKAARITVDESNAEALLKRSFWPSPVYARRWNFQTKAETQITTVDQPNTTEVNSSVDQTN